MKKLIIILLIIALGLVFVLPWWGAEEDTIQQNSSQDTVLSHSFEGVFTGELPCADCSGIETTLQLFSDGHYELTENYKEKGTFTSSGQWQIFPQNQKINLIQDKQFYKITKDGHLYRLNDQGEPSSLQFDMTLKKQP